MRSRSGIRLEIFKNHPFGRGGNGRGYKQVRLFTGISRRAAIIPAPCLAIPAGNHRHGRSHAQPLSFHAHVGASCRARISRLGVGDVALLQQSMRRRRTSARPDYGHARLCLHAVRRQLLFVANRAHHARYWQGARPVQWASPARFSRKGLRVPPVRIIGARAHRAGRDVVDSGERSDSPPE